MNKIRFLKLEEIIAINQDQIKRFGGIHGIRDYGLLESALHSPKASFSQKYLHRNIYEMAAAYILGIIKNHPFIDGNKRTGLISGLLFLQRNGVKLNLTLDQAFDLAIDVASSKISIAEITTILQNNSKK